VSSAYEAGIARAREILVAARSASDHELGALAPDLASELLAASNAGAEENERERADRIRALLDDPIGQAFVSALTDRAHRSSSGARLVQEVKALSDALGAPRSLASWDRLELRALRLFGSSVPELTARAVRRRIYEDAVPYLAPAEPNRLATFLEERARQGLRVNLNHLGEEVMGDADADRFLSKYLELLARPEVDTISVKLSSIDARIDLVAWEATLARLGEKLERIYRAALEHAVERPSGAREPKLVYLDMEAYRDLELTVELFTRVLERPGLSSLTAGIVLQAYVPDSHGYQARLVDWARRRVERGGAPVRQRLVKGANLMLERIDASQRGLPLVTFGSKTEVDASFRRMLSFGATPANAAAVRLGIGSHNLFDIAYALLLREQRKVVNAVEIEMLEGMADPLRRVVQRVAGRVLVYAPSVDEREFPSAVAYLVRRLDENTAQDNFLRRSFAMRPGDLGFVAERARFETGLRAAASVDTRPKRSQRRDAEVSHAPRAGFENEPDTDFSAAANREWLSRALEAMKTRKHPTLESFVAGAKLGGELRRGFDPSRPGVVPYEYQVVDRAVVEASIATLHASAGEWARTAPEQREELLLRVAEELRRARGELVAAMVLDAGKRALEADAEVSEAIDFAEYYARQHARLRERKVLGPKGLVVVAPPWNFPLSIGVGGVLAALVGGNAVLYKPPPETPLVAALAANALVRAGIPAHAFGLLFVEDDAAGALVTDPRVAAVVLTGGTETARLFKKLRPGLDLVAETGGKNAMLVSAMSDREQAVAHAVRSAFGHSGQKCSALSLLILDREVYRSASFRAKLEDATRTLKVGSAWDVESVVTPLIRPPSGALARALDSLEPEETWLVAPERSTDNERLVGPGVRLGVREGSFAHMTELFGPVLSVLEAQNFEHALALANRTPYGLTAGLESLDTREEALFLRSVRAGNLYVNRPVTGAVVGRQPFGGHKASSFGAGFKAGGPNAILGLVRVLGERDRGGRGAVPLSRGPRVPVTEAPDSAEPLPPPPLGPFENPVAELFKNAPKSDKDALARRLKSYERALTLEIIPQHAQDEVLGHEDTLVYVRCRVAIVLLSGTSALDALSALIAAEWVGSPPVVLVDGSFDAISAELVEVLEAERFSSTADLVSRLSVRTLDRVRVIGPSAGTVALALEGSAPSVESGAVHDSGYVELRRYVLEQASSIARHRHGNMSLPLALRSSRPEPSS
jgi:RHH-type proline utilization regulon transcriptional repressor/proline dehydrogenase/delta 1-pyrroline-5-carboxylate dehydrogenase